MGEGSGRGSGRVRLFVGNRGRVGSTFRRVGSGQRKVTVDNSGQFRLKAASLTHIIIQLVRKIFQIQLVSR